MHSCIWLTIAFALLATIVVLHVAMAAYLGTAALWALVNCRNGVWRQTLAQLHEMSTCFTLRVIPLVYKVQSEHMHLVKNYT